MPRKTVRLSYLDRGLPEMFGMVIKRDGVRGLVTLREAEKIDRLWWLDMDILHRTRIDTAELGPPEYYEDWDAPY